MTLTPIQCPSCASNNTHLEGNDAYRCLSCGTLSKITVPQLNLLLGTSNQYHEIDLESRIKLATDGLKSGDIFEARFHFDYIYNATMGKSGFEFFFASALLVRGFAASADSRPDDIKIQPILSAIDRAHEIVNNLNLEIARLNFNNTINILLVLYLTNKENGMLPKLEKWEHDYRTMDETKEEIRIALNRLYQVMFKASIHATITPTLEYAFNYLQHFAQRQNYQKTQDEAIQLKKIYQRFELQNSNSTSDQLDTPASTSSLKLDPSDLNNSIPKSKISKKKVIYFSSTLIAIFFATSITLIMKSEYATTTRSSNISIETTPSNNSLPSKQRDGISTASTTPLSDGLKGLLPLWEKTKYSIDGQAVDSGCIGWPTASSWRDPFGSAPALINGELGSENANNLWSNRRVLIHWNGSSRRWTAFVLMEKRSSPGRYQLVLVEDLFGSPKLMCLPNFGEGGPSCIIGAKRRGDDESPTAWLAPFVEDRNPLVFFVGPYNTDNLAEFVFDNERGISTRIDGIKTKLNEWITKEPVLGFGETLRRDEWDRSEFLEERSGFTWFSVDKRLFITDTSSYRAWESTIGRRSSVQTAPEVGVNSIPSSNKGTLRPLEGTGDNPLNTLAGKAPSKSTEQLDAPRDKASKLSAGQISSLARVINQVQPQFPRRALQMRAPISQDLTVRVKVFVSERGQPIKVSLIESASSSFGFDEAAIEAANKSTYTPALIDGKPVGGWTNEISFRFSGPK